MDRCVHTFKQSSYKKYRILSRAFWEILVRSSGFKEAGIWHTITRIIPDTKHTNLGLLLNIDISDFLYFSVLYLLLYAVFY